MYLLPFPSLVKRNHLGSEDCGLVKKQDGGGNGKMCHPRFVEKTGFNSKNLYKFNSSTSMFIFK